MRWKTRATALVALLNVLSCHCLDHITMNISIREAAIVRVIESHAATINVDKFYRDPVTVQTHSTTYYISQEKQNVVFAKKNPDMGKDSILLSSTDNKFAISTPRGAKKRQFVLLKKSPNHELQSRDMTAYYMSFVYVRQTVENETASTILSIPEGNFIPEYDIWEQRSNKFYAGWMNCDFTALFTCTSLKAMIEDANAKLNTRRRKREIRPEYAEDALPEERHFLAKRQVWNGESLPELIPIKGALGHDPGDYNDLYLDFDFHRLKELGIHGSNLHEVLEVKEGSHRRKKRSATARKSGGMTRTTARKKDSVLSGFFKGNAKASVGFNVGASAGAGVSGSAGAGVDGSAGGKASGGLFGGLFGKGKGNAGASGSGKGNIFSGFANLVGGVGKVATNAVSGTLSSFNDISRALPGAAMKLGHDIIGNVVAPVSDAFGVNGLIEDLGLGGLRDSVVGIADSILTTGENLLSTWDAVGNALIDNAAKGLVTLGIPPSWAKLAALGTQLSFNTAALIPKGFWLGWRLGADSAGTFVNGGKYRGQGFDDTDSIPSNHETIFGFLYSGGDSGKRFFFPEDVHIYGTILFDNGATISGYFKPSPPGIDDSFFPDDESMAMSKTDNRGKFLPKEYNLPKDSEAGIIGWLRGGNRWECESGKMKSVYDPSEPEWKDQIWMPEVTTTELAPHRPTETVNGDKIVYGCLFPGMDESASIFVAEGDSISGFFVCMDNEHPEIKDIPHGVFTPNHPAGHASFVAGNPNEVTSIQECYGTFVPDAMELSGGITGNLIHTEESDIKFSLVLDRPGVDYTYIPESEEVKDIWCPYMNAEDWKQTPPPLTPDDVDDVDDSPEPDDDEESQKKVWGTKITTKKTVVFLPMDANIEGSLLILDNMRTRSPLQVSVVASKPEEQWIIQIAKEASKGQAGLSVNLDGGAKVQGVKANTPCLFIPKNFPNGDGISGHVVIEPNGQTGKFKCDSASTGHFFKAGDNLWVPKEFKKEHGMKPGIDGSSESQEQNLENPEARSSAHKGVSLHIPGVLQTARPPPKTKANYRFGPKFSARLGFSFKIQAGASANAGMQGRSFSGSWSAGGGGGGSMSGGSSMSGGGSMRGSSSGGYSGGGMSSSGGGSGSRWRGGGSGSMSGSGGMSSSGGGSGSYGSRWRGGGSGSMSGSGGMSSSDGGSGSYGSRWGNRGSSSGGSNMHGDQSGSSSSGGHISVSGGGHGSPSYGEHSSERDEVPSSSNSNSSVRVGGSWNRHGDSSDDNNRGHGRKKTGWNAQFSFGNHGKGDGGSDESSNNTGGWHIKGGWGFGGNSSRRRRPNNSSFHVGINGESFSSNNGSDGGWHGQASWNSKHEGSTSHENDQSGDHLDAGGEWNSMDNDSDSAGAHGEAGWNSKGTDSSSNNTGHSGGRWKAGVKWGGSGGWGGSASNGGNSQGNSHGSWGSSGGDGHSQGSWKGSANSGGSRWGSSASASIGGNSQGNSHGSWGSSGGDGHSQGSWKGSANSGGSGRWGSSASTSIGGNSKGNSHGNWGSSGSASTGGGGHSQGSWGGSANSGGSGRWGSSASASSGGNSRGSGSWSGGVSFGGGASASAQSGRSFDDIEAEDDEGEEGKSQEYVHGFYIKSPESDDPLFVPDTGAKGKFVPDSGSEGFTGIYFPERLDKPAKFIFDDDPAPVSVGTKGRFHTTNHDEEMSKAFYSSKVGENGLTHDDNPEVIPGWQEWESETIDESHIPLRHKSVIEEGYLTPTQKPGKFALVDVGGGFKGTIVDGPEAAVDDPNNPIFQEYLHYRAQKEGDINPWGKVHILDPLIRDPNHKKASGKKISVPKGTLINLVDKPDSIANVLMAGFRTKNWEYSQAYENPELNSQHIMFGATSNLANMMDYRMWILNKFNLKRAGVNGEMIALYVPKAAEAFLKIKSKARSSLGLNLGGISAKNSLVHCDCATQFSKLFGMDEREVRKHDLSSDPDMPVHADQSGENWCDETTCDEIRLDDMQLAQAQASMMRDTKQPKKITGMNLGFSLVSGQGSNLKFTDVAKKMLKMYDKKKIESERKEVKGSSGPSTTDLLGSASTDIDNAAAQSAIHEKKVFGGKGRVQMQRNFQIDEETGVNHAKILPGWKTQHRPLITNATLSANGVIYYGLGNCEQKVVPPTADWIKEPAKLIEYYLQVMRVDCMENINERIYNLINEGFLKIDKNDKFFEIPSNLKLLRTIRLTPMELKKLSVAFEFHAFTRTYCLIREKGYLPEGVVVEPKVTITRSTAFLTELSFYIISRSRRIVPFHGIRMIRNQLSTLRTVLTKLHQDAIALEECETCDLDKKLTAGDKFRIVSLIQFIIHGQGPFEKKEMRLRPAFEQFVDINEQALRQRVEEFERQFPRRRV